MAEPARQLGDDSESVYDEPTGTAPSNPTPNLKVLEGGGETTEPKRGHLRSLGDHPSRDKLSKTEAQAGQSGDSVNHVYKPDNVHKLSNIQPSVRGVVKFARTNRGKIIIGGAAASIVTLLIIGFFALLPFKILHIVNNLQSKFFATSENAVTKETDVLFSNYLKKYVLPGITNCKGTIDKTCTPRAVSGTGLVSKLYRGWSTARLENTLADKYGLEFQYKKTTGHYYLKTGDTPGDGVDLGTQNSGFIKSPDGLDDYLAKSNDPEFKLVSRSEVRQAVKDSLSGETKFKQVMYRFKVGRLLEEKYGIKRCIIACTLQDNFSEWKNQKAIAAKALLAQRILEPRGEMLGVVLECLADPKCDPTHVNTTGTCTVGVDCEADGEDVSSTEKDVQSKLDALAAKYGSEDVLKLYNDLEEKGFTQFTIEQILKSILGDEAGAAAGETASKALGPAGWISLASQMVTDINSAPQKIQKLSYVVNASSMVATFAMYRTYADEIKNGHVDSTIVGSFTDSLGAIASSGMGGTAEAEQTPLYSQLLGNGTASGSSTYRCNDGKLVPAGQSVCPEMQLNAPNNFAMAISKFKSSFPFFSELNALASLWNKTLGGVFNYVVNFLSGIINYVIPQLGQTVGYVIDKIAGPFLQYLMNQLIPPIVSDNMSGGRTFDAMAGGADISGNDYAHNGLGGQELSSSQVTAILNEQQQEYQAQHSHDSLIARMFDTNSNNSLVTKLAMAMPTSFSDVKSSVASLLSGPFRGMGSAFSIGHAQAAAAADPFGITQYGFAINDPIYTTDPETYWDNNCTTDGTTIDPTKPVNAAWHQSVVINPETQMPENTTTDPCYLIQAAVGSDGGLTNPGVLTQDDLGGQ